MDTRRREFLSTVATVLRIVILSLPILFVWSGSSTRAAECPVPPPPYEGPIFDTSVQAWNPRVAGLIGVAQNAGVKRIAMYGNSKEGAGSDSAMAVLALAQANPDLVLLGAPKIGFIQGGDLPPGYVTDIITGVRSGKYKFVGEILYTHGDKPDHPPTRTGDIFVNPLASGTKQLLSQLSPFNVPLMTHFEAWAWDRDKPNFDKLYAAWPQQRFVLPSLAYGSADKADAILSAHSNLWGIISRLVDGRYQFVDATKAAKLGPSMFDECGMLRPDWRAVLIKHSDRLMYGSDFYANRSGNWLGYAEPIDQYRRIAGQLPADVAARISWDNAAALYGAQ